MRALSPKTVDLHLVATAHLAAGREALRLLGLSWIHTTDVELQGKIFSAVIDVAVPFASHCRRLIELTNIRLSEDQRVPFHVELEIDDEQKRAEYPTDLKSALDLILHSRTLKGAFARVREKEINATSKTLWTEAAVSAAIREHHGCLGAPGQNPWRYSPILKIETDKRTKHSIPTVSLAMMYFEKVEPRTLKTFGGELSKWTFFDAS